MGMGIGMGMGCGGYMQRGEQSETYMGGGHTGGMGGMGGWQGRRTIREQHVRLLHVEFCG